ncbi:hypothetical protein [Streptomyces olivaceoviridis]|uniref:hypothetical protein n=1 Tax=Streptomyces olivaceoviridis TaxID=1921 RepID=UPI0036FC1007
MTAPSARARDTPGRAVAPPPFDGELFIDMDNVRARYECLRPGCPHPLEGPVCANDRVTDAEGRPARRGPSGVAAFIAGIKAHHLAQYDHRSTR